MCSRGPVPSIQLPHSSSQAAGKTRETLKCVIQGLVTSLLVLPTPCLFAQNSCDAVLVPSKQQTSDNYRIMQAYMKLNASHEYDRLQHLDQSQLGVQASYGMYSAQYNQSHTASDFNEKVQDKLQQDQFNMAEDQAREYYRVGLDSEQIDAWARCKQGQGGGLLVSAKNMTKDGFTLIVRREPPPGVGNPAIQLKVRNGTVNGQTSLSVQLTGAGETNYSIDRSSTEQTVTVEGNMNDAFQDSVLVDYSPVPPPPPPPTHTVFKQRYVAT